MLRTSSAVLIVFPRRRNFVDEISFSQSPNNVFCRPTICYFVFSVGELFEKSFRQTSADRLAFQCYTYKLSMRSTQWHSEVF
jgi:hypothetical protein